MIVITVKKAQPCSDLGVACILQYLCSTITGCEKRTLAVAHSSLLQTGQTELFEETDAQKYDPGKDHSPWVKLLGQRL